MVVVACLDIIMLEAAVEDASKLVLKGDGGGNVACDVPMCTVTGPTVELGDSIDLTDCLFLDQRQPTEWVPRPINSKSK